MADYRELPDGSFDAIASIGMSEHVGESQIDNYAKSLFALLRPGGVLLNHAIAALDPEYDSLDDEFSMRYVFPDGEALPFSRVQLALERAGFHVDHVEGFREDYARTLREWTKRLDEHLRARRAARRRGAHADLAAVSARRPARLRHEHHRRLPGPRAQAHLTRHAGPPRHHTGLHIAHRADAHRLSPLGRRYLRLLESRSSRPSSTSVEA